MTKRTLYTALLALFVGGSAAVPVQAQTLGQRVPAAQNERAPDRAGEPVTVRVANNNWLDMRIYVVETAILQRRWPLGDVTGLSTARFEIPKHLGAPYAVLFPLKHWKNGSEVAELEIRGEAYAPEPPAQRPK